MEWICCKNCGNSFENIVSVKTVLCTIDCNFDLKYS